jgi:uncharacterized protein with FMN-binding domain
VITHSRRFKVAILAGSALAPIASATVPLAQAATTKNYRGPSVAMRWGNIQVTIRVSGHRVVNLSATYPTERERSVIINTQAIPWLRGEVLKAQSARVNAIGGATLTSQAFVGSLSAALKAAHV